MAPGLRALKGVVAGIAQHPGGELRKPKARQRTTLCSVVRCPELEFLVDRRSTEVLQKHYKTY